MKKTELSKHFVIFESPGTFVHETTEREIDSWDVAKASEMAHEIKERYGATPFAFYFTTRARKANDLDSKVIRTSPRYFLGGSILTVGDVRKAVLRDDRDYSILLSNMESNHFDRVVENNNSWLSFNPLSPGDVVLDWKPRK